MKNPDCRQRHRGARHIAEVITCLKELPLSEEEIVQACIWKVKKGGQLSYDDRIKPCVYLLLHGRWTSVKIPRFLIAAGASGSGKTLITCGILKALCRRGKKVSSFKCGPDYIDPMFHARVIGTKARNLDTFFTGEETTRYLLEQNAAGTEISVIEGVMGYYDGLGGTDTKASTYDVARVTKTPVIFVVNTKGMSLSVIPYLKGFLEYKKDSGICGVILNQISPMLYPQLKKR